MIRVQIRFSRNVISRDVCLNTVSNLKNDHTHLTTTADDRVIHTTDIRTDVYCGIILTTYNKVTQS